MIMNVVLVTTASSSAAKPTASEMAGSPQPAGDRGLTWTAGLRAIRR